MGACDLHTDPILASIVAHRLFYYRDLWVVTPPAGAVLREPPSAALQRRLLWVCNRGGKPEQPRSSCARVEENSCWVDIWVRRKLQAHQLGQAGKAGSL